MKRSPVKASPSGEEQYKKYQPAFAAGYGVAGA
jgi:hypothetical protein